MANEIYSSSYWGNGVCDNTIDWGVVYKDYAGCTPSFTNTYSLAFDGVDDYLDISPPIPLGLTSISFWMKSTDIAGAKGITNGLGQLNFIGTSPIVRLNSTNYRYFADQVANFDGNFHHWFLLIAGSGQSDITNSRLFVDGVEVLGSTAISSGLPLAWGVSQIGTGFYGSINASIDEFAIWQSDETANVSTIYNSGSPTNLSDLTTPPLHWYRNGDNGTWKSPQWLIPNNENKTKFSNYSFEYDGVDDYIQLSSVVSFASEFSLSIWVKPNGINTNQVILGNGSSSNNWVRLSSASSITFKVGSTSLNFADVGNNLVDGIWQHLLFYRDSSNNVGIFRNGTAFSTTQSNTNTLELSTIAKRGNIEYTGLIDEVAFWQSDKSSDVSSIYNSGVPTDISSLSPVGYWRSENSTFLTNWTVTDNGSGSNDGTSANMTIEDRVGDAPNSTSNALSYNMDEVDRETDVPT